MTQQKDEERRTRILVSPGTPGVLGAWKRLEERLKRGNIKGEFQYYHWSSLSAHYRGPRLRAPSRDGTRRDPPGGRAATAVIARKNG